MMQMMRIFIFLIIYFFDYTSLAPKRACAQTTTAQTASTKPVTNDAVSQLKEARYQYTQGNYPQVIALLEPLLSPQIQLKNEEDLVEARKTLGIVYFLYDKIKEARTQFELLLYANKDVKLDPYSTAPQVLAFFDNIQQQEQDKTSEAARLFAERKLRFEAPQIIQQRWQKNSRILVYMPFGVGQFQNGHTRLGITFLSLQTVFLAMNIMGYIMAQLCADDQGRIPLKRLNVYHAWLGVQYTGLGAFLATWTASAIHAHIYFQPYVLIEQPKKNNTNNQAHTHHYQAGLLIGGRF